MFLLMIYIAYWLMKMYSSPASSVRSTSLESSFSAGYVRRFDCLRRRIIVEKSSAEASTDGEVFKVPGLLRSYDKTNGLFTIRYADGNRQAFRTRSHPIDGLASSFQAWEDVEYHFIVSKVLQHNCELA